MQSDVWTLTHPSHTMFRRDYTGGSRSCLTSQSYAGILKAGPPVVHCMCIGRWTLSSALRVSDWILTNYTLLHSLSEPGQTSLMSHLISDVEVDTCHHSTHTQEVLCLNEASVVACVHSSHGIRAVAKARSVGPWVVLTASSNRTRPFSGHKQPQCYDLEVYVYRLLQVTISRNPDCFHLVQLPLSRSQGGSVYTFVHRGLAK